MLNLEGSPVNEAFEERQTGLLRRCGKSKMGKAKNEEKVAMKDGKNRGSVCCRGRGVSNWGGGSGVVRGEGSRSGGVGEVAERKGERMERRRKRRWKE